MIQLALIIVSVLYLCGVIDGRPVAIIALIEVAADCVIKTINMYIERQNEYGFPFDEEE